MYNLLGTIFALIWVFAMISPLGAISGLGMFIAFILFTVLLLVPSLFFFRLAKKQNAKIIADAIAAKDKQ